VNETENSAKRFNVDRLQQQLRTLFFGIGSRLVYMPTVDSTNIQAMQLAQAGSEEGVVVLADSQTAGKGRQGRRWVDRYGYNVLSSTVLRPSFPPYLLVMIASLAVVEAITEICGERRSAATIKWPNDILIGDRKVAGILIETSHDRTGSLLAIMGIGVNINGRFPFKQDASPEELQLAATATTLEAVYGQPISRESFLASLLQHIEAYYLALQQEAQDPWLIENATGSFSRAIREKWRSYLSTLGRSIQVRQGDSILHGIAEDVNETGELLLRLHSGERISITWGDIGYPTE
jgi:BirA family biotin operon repressor/biotin-[acetyl-CoA-carboxylase] ligase